MEIFCKNLLFQEKIIRKNFVIYLYSYMNYEVLTFLLCQFRNRQFDSTLNSSL